jgi:hypothetical protein
MPVSTPPQSVDDDQGAEPMSARLWRVEKGLHPYTRLLTTLASELRTFAPPNTTSKGNTASTSTVSKEFRKIAEMWRFRRTNGNFPGLMCNRTWSLHSSDFPIGLELS